MLSESEISALLHEQYALYPKMTVQDMVKVLYQAEFGCGHFAPNEKRALKLIMQEEAALRQDMPKPPFMEPIGSDFCRVHIARMSEKGLSAQTLAQLFMLSAEPAGSMTHFRLLLSDLYGMIVRREFKSICAEDAARFLEGYSEQGCRPVHHSEAFRNAYAPAYRVIRADFARFLPLFCAIDQLMREKDRITVAIEGSSASGKSTLGELLKKVYDCNLFHMDDFFLQMHQRTPQRFEEIGGNVDYERFRSEVLCPLSTGKPFSYRVFDCSCMALGETIEVCPKKLNIVEGAYSMHPSFGDVYDLSAFIYVDSKTQKFRILERNGKNMLHRFIDEWIPLEEKYFEGTRVYEKCTFVL